MNCGMYRGGLIEMARSGAGTAELRRHLEGCAECARLLESQRALQGALAGLMADAGVAPVPEHVEARVFAELAQASVRSRRPALRLALAMAASLLAAVWLVRAPAPRPAPRSSAAAPFLRVPYVVPPAPYERTAVMRMDVPVAALIAAGFEVHLPDTGGAVRADVLVGQDGRALAIRLVPGSISNSQRRLN